MRVVARWLAGRQSVWIEDRDRGIGFTTEAGESGDIAGGGFWARGGAWISYQ